MTEHIDRRTFLRTMAAGGGSLVLGVWLAACTGDSPSSTTSTLAASTTTGIDTVPPTTGIAGDPAASFGPDLLLRIDGDETITVTVPKSEMGQGVRTSLAMLVAEELDADWSRVRVETADGDRGYGNQVTGGSLSISSRFDSMRRVGAAARTMLIAAAAGAWDVDPANCRTEPGAVVGGDDRLRATYGELAALAAELDPPSPGEIEVKHPVDFRIIGEPLGAVDAPAVVTGSAVYGSDIVIDGMSFAVVARPPTLGARVTSWDDTAARSIPGVVDVVEISTGVAVLAENTWAALQGRDALVVQWDNGDDSPVDDGAVGRALAEGFTIDEPTAGELAAEYSHPFLPHLAMEPLVCTATVSSDECEVWAGTQDPQLARAVAGRGSSLPGDRVGLHVPLLGGGFGRRLDQDFVEEAAELAAAAGGPVKVFWTRTDDLRHDRFHPAGISRAVGHPGDPSGIRIETRLAHDLGVPTGSWRSVTNAPEAFARESFIAELAHAAGGDAYEYRRELLDGRALATLDAVAGASGWGEELPSGWGRGIAHHATWGVSPTSMVAIVSVEEGRVRVRRVVCAIDCGIVVNPDTVVAQIEGAIAFGATAALLGGVTVSGGSITEENFNDAPILRYDEMPEVDVIMMPSEAAPSGVGEAGVPPIAPAIANAIFDATGVRLRDLPLTLPGTDD